MESLFTKCKFPFCYAVKGCHFCRLAFDHPGVTSCCRKLNDSHTSISESDEWKTRAQTAEERVKQLEKDIQHYNDDMIVMSARKQDLANLTKYKDEVKKLTGQVNYYRYAIC